MYKLSQGPWEFRKSSVWAWSTHLGSKMCPANPGPLCSPWSPWITRRPSESRNRNASPARMSLGPFCDAVAPRTWGCWWRRDDWRNSDDLASGVLRAPKPSDVGPGDAALESSGRLRGPGSDPEPSSCQTGIFCARCWTSWNEEIRSRCSSQSCCSSRPPRFSDPAPCSVACRTWSAFASSDSSRFRTCSRNRGEGSKTSLCQAYPGSAALSGSSRWRTASGG